MSAIKRLKNRYLISDRQGRGLRLDFTAGMWTKPTWHLSLRPNLGKASIEWTLDEDGIHLDRALERGLAEKDLTEKGSRFSRPSHEAWPCQENRNQVKISQNEFRREAAHAIQGSRCVDRSAAAAAAACEFRRKTPSLNLHFLWRPEPLSNYLRPHECYPCQNTSYSVRDGFCAMQTDRRTNLQYHPSQ